MLDQMASGLLRGLLSVEVKPAVSVVIPTIRGREDSLARAIAAYEDTMTDVSHEIIIIKDNPTWPGACNKGYSKAKAGVILFTADDLEPLPGWHEDVLPWLSEHDELPTGKVLNHSADGDFDNREDGPDRSVVWFTRLPIMRRDQWERIGQWPEIYHYADVWLSEKARTLGIETRIFYSYAFVHHWSQVGRKPYTEEAWATLERLRTQMV